MDKTEKKDKWKKIALSREERPLVQDYKGYSELPPIPISIPQKGAIGLTSQWRTYKPVIDYEKCNNCGLCYIYCPDATVLWNEEKQRYEIDYDYCKGCMICAKHCPAKCISSEREVK